jgi:hypothetical protein
MPARLPKSEYDEYETLRIVGATKAYFSFKGALRKVPQALRGERLAIRAPIGNGQNGEFFAAYRIAIIDLINPQCVSDFSEQLSTMSLGRTSSRAMTGGGIAARPRRRKPARGSAGAPPRKRVSPSTPKSA